MAIDLERVEAERERIKQTYLKESPDRPPSSARGIHHTALLSSDVERTVRFYQEVLEFPLIEIFENRDYRGSNHFFFDLGNGNALAFFDFPGLDLGEYAEVLGRPAPHRHLGRTGKLGTAEAEPRGGRGPARDPQRGLALLQGPRRGAPRVDRRPTGRDVRDASARVGPQPGQPRVRSAPQDHSNPGLGSTGRVAANPGLDALGESADRPDRCGDGEGGGGQRLPAHPLQLGAAFGVEPGDVGARRTHAERVGLPPLLECGVLDLDR